MSKKLQEIDECIKDLCDYDAKERAIKLLKEYRAVVADECPHGFRCTVMEKQPTTKEE